MERLGCFSWLLLVVVCAAPFKLLGASDGVTLGAGLVLSFVVLGFVEAMHRRTRVSEMREALNDDSRDA